jgi:hypothetical protein
MRSSARAVIACLLALAATLAAGCKPRPRPGDVCAGPEMGHGACVDLGHALTCRAFTWRLDTCHGPAGCTPLGEAVRCDQRVADEGDSCAERDARACSTDGATLLQCDGARMISARRCRGPRGCHRDAPDSAPACDQGYAAAGDPCDAGGTHCASDGRAILRCASSHHYVVERPCPGPRGCFRAADAPETLVCDVSSGDVGERCEADGGAWCSRDGAQENTCRAGSLVKRQVCATRCVARWSADGRSYQVACNPL